MGRQNVMLHIAVLCKYSDVLLDFMAKYEETSMTGLSANPTVAVPLLTINGWILMQRKINGSSVSFNQTWTTYGDGFGSATGNDNYWMGLDKVYRLIQLGSVTLRVEVGGEISSPIRGGVMLPMATCQQQQ